ncbi:MAG: carbohydrate kinase [Myxococcales bacterium]|nr:carbohydrate kinase [Myxococcales bacterium]
MTDTRKPVFIFGEVLCDMFSPEPGIPLKTAPVFVPHIGGAPANVAAQVAWQGWPVEMISAVGLDPISDRIECLLSARGVGTEHVLRKPGTRTGLILIEIDGEGERHFHPWREGSADEQMRPEDLPTEAIASAAILHHGTVTLRVDPVATTNRRAVTIAREAGVPVSIDVNLRPKMFQDPGVLYQRARNAVLEADIVKASLDEAEVLFDGTPEGGYVSALLGLGARLVLLTDAHRPFVIATRHHRIEVAPPRAQTVDTTGAGDAFMGAALAWISERRLDLDGIDALTPEDLQALGERAGQAGARAVTAIGACGGFPIT